MYSYYTIHACMSGGGEDGRRLEEKNVKHDDGIYIFTAAIPSSSHVCSDKSMGNMSIK